jgi:diguanylate cyclase (GGDEF)-like protein/PAS domain S-box-containing protein
MDPVLAPRGEKAVLAASQAPGLVGVVLPTVVAVVLAQLVVGLAWRDHLIKREETLYAQVARDASLISVKIRDRIVTYGLVLRGAGALFSTERQVTRSGWRNFVDRLSLYRDYPGIQGVGFSRALVPDQVAAHERAVRAEGVDDYRVWPEGRRELISAITYLEPDTWRNRRALGFDMYSEPVRREAMRRARESGDLALSGKVILVHETAGDVQAGVLLYLPLNGMATGGPQPFLGWVYSPFRMNDLIGKVLGDFPEELRLRIYDGEQPTPQSLLFDSHPLASDASFKGLEEPPEPRPYFNPLLVEGRRWTLQFDRLPGYGDEHPRVSPGLAMLTALAVLMVAGTWMLFSFRYQARRLAALSESLRLREEQYATLVNLSREGICAVNREMRFTFVNPRLAEWLGGEAVALRGRSYSDFFAAGGGVDPSAILTRLRAGRGETYELRLGGVGTRERVVLVSDHPLRDESASFLGATMVLTDVTERQLAAERIHFLATHDVLTGVPNRVSVRERLAQSIALARRYNRKVGVLFIDLDYFKEVNDTYGHGVGDQVLVESVHRIRECLRSTDSVGRLGGDEFMVVLPELETAGDGHAVANKIVELLERPMVVQGHEIHISASVGMVLFPDDGVDEETLVNQADAAMYRAKCGGRGRVETGHGGAAA